MNEQTDIDPLLPDDNVERILADIRANVERILADIRADVEAIRDKYGLSVAYRRALGYQLAIITFTDMLHIQREQAAAALAVDNPK